MSSMANDPAISIPTDKQRTGVVFFASWIALLLCIGGFALGLALVEPRTVAAPAATASATTQASSKLAVGARVPDFTLRDHAGTAHHLQETLNKGPVLLVFYLSLNCQHCVAQLGAIGEAQERLARRQVTIFGISADTPDFTKQELEGFGPLSFALLADEDHAVARKYGVYQDGPQPITLHGVFLIGQDGRVRFMETGEETYMDVEEIENQAAKVGEAVKSVKP